MNRIIRLDVRDEFISGAGQVVGAAGSHDDVELELAFSPMWAGTAKKIVWFDALGENPVVTALGTDLLVPGELEAYRVPVPPEAKAVEGDMCLTIRGVNTENGVETRAVVAATARFKVLPALWDPLAEESTDESAGQADQLRAEIEKIKADVVGAGQAADALEQTLAAAAQANQSATAAGNRASAAQSSAQEAAGSAKTAFDSAQTAMEYSGNPPVIRDGTWHTWNAWAKTYEDTGSTARGERGAQGETGPQGLRGAKGETGAQGPRGPAGPQGNVGPTGPQGPAGPAGAQGQRGPAGADGRSFTVKGLYPSRLALETAHPLGEAGDAWAVGTADNNRVYLWDADRMAWTDVGPLQGPAGPEGAAGPQGPQGPQGVQGPEGEAGRSAYEYAAEGGYTGTEDEFRALIASGPWLPTSGGTLTGALSVPQNGGLIVKGPEATMLGDEDIRIEHEADMDASLPEVKFVQYLDGVRAPDNKVCLTGLDIPRLPDGAATKGYVDNKVAAGGGCYAVCSTAAGTAAKTASCEGFTLKTGSAVAVKFANANSVSSPTLNVNGTGAKSIKAYGTMGVITGGMAGLWEAGSIVPFVYDGTNWVMANGCLAQRLRYLQNTALILGADGSMPGPVLACPDSNHGAAQLRNIYFTTTDLTAGTSYLDSGAIAIVYEE